MMPRQQPVAITMDDGIGGHHFRIKRGMGRQHAVENTAMTIGPIHHRRNRKAMGARLGTRLAAGQMRHLASDIV